MRQTIAVAALALTLMTYIPVYATVQENDEVIYNGARCELDVQTLSPLEVLYAIYGVDPPFRAWSTANWRGHIATWEVSDGVLYLNKIRVERPEARSRTAQYVPLTQVFRDLPSTTQVQASWFTGTVLILCDPQQDPLSGGTYALGDKHYVGLDLSEGIVVDAHLFAATDIAAAIQYRTASFIAPTTPLPLSLRDINEPGQQLASLSALFLGGVSFIMGWVLIFMPMSIAICPGGKRMFPPGSDLSRTKIYGLYMTVLGVIVVVAALVSLVTGSQ